LGHWANATSQGLAVGKTMTGLRTKFETASSYTTNFFDPPLGGSCSFLGVTDEKFADSIVVRGSAKVGKVTRIFVKKYDGISRIVGATVINNPSDVAPLTMIIKGMIDIGTHLADITSNDFDLKNLVAS
jgi:hypothetical protein